MVKHHRQLFRALEQNLATAPDRNTVEVAKLDICVLGIFQYGCLSPYLERFDGLIVLINACKVYPDIRDWLPFRVVIAP